MQYAVLSSTADLSYSFFLPIVCKLWRRLNFVPLVLLPSGDWDKPAAKFALDSADAVLRVIGPIREYKLSTAAQVGRLAAASCEGIKPDDWLLTTDIDMFPFSKDCFRPWVSKRRFVVYGGDAYKGETRWPMCYIGAKAEEWRAAFKLKGPLTGDTSRLLRIGGKDNWNMDERLAGRIIENGMVEVLPRGWREGRALERQDRAAWSNKAGPYIDCHALRPGWEHWSKLSAVIRFHAPDVADWADKYHKDFVAKFTPAGVV